ncbi:hypothetical protein V511_12200 [Mesotoga sp. Brook.08.YT.4.2.5.1]|uniref:hypothetical protein n=1 Tax=unclassified Mesotoga TaxID=1184398 RepID=UPI000C17D69D|nr:MULTISPECIES: hypothetical protein [unclassified Mesotoga]PNE19881.1 hypothetical protein V511_12200 [Mesotoga sp. Brook.08.YT.4.2.5.1]PVD18214.1 hypothetical protein V512_015215 [Mesotoga sp. Brook.08.105.5.1]RAO96545.1 hypothetical protein M388_14195 [Mesotoga sp. Brook.08.YT.4.2.5.4.]RDI93694.1 hypothetical protein Q502_04380 [Mesotoga sp. Brook.08.YT.4.2.5.2.]
MKSVDVMFLPGDKVYLEWELDLGSFTPGDVVETRIGESQNTYMVHFNNGTAEYPEHELVDHPAAKKRIIAFYNEQIARLEGELC